MNLEKQDWQKLQLPLMMLATVTLLVMALLGFALHFKAGQELALQAQQRKFEVASQRYRSSGTEKAMIAEYLPEYQALIGKGFVGEERRIEWVEHLRELHRQHRLFSIKYSISQQEKYSPVFAPGLGGFALNRSVMRLELDMLHEGDLLQLTEALDTENSTPFILRDCEINRLNAGSPLSGQLAANLHALCEIDWLTLREPASANLPPVLE